MRFVAEVSVTLKAVVNDPQGLVVRDSLHQLGFNEVVQVRVGKEVVIELDAGSDNEAKTRVVEMCEKLLRNPVIEDYEIAIKPAPAVPA